MPAELPNLDISERDGLFMATFPVCTWQVLPLILDSTMPWIWLHRHSPMRYLEWWPTQARLSEKGPLHDIELRTATYDVQLPTSKFLEVAPEFDRHGIDLFQMHRRIPNTLWLERLEGNAKPALNRIVIENGLHLRFVMNHAGEAAFLYMPERHLLEKIAQNPAVRRIAFRHKL